MRKIIPFLVCIFMLTGCYDNVEIDDLAYVVAIGIDKGTQKTYSVTLQYAVPLNISGGVDAEKSEGAPLSSATFETDSLLTVSGEANSKMAKITDLSQLQLLLFSEDAAKMDLGHIKEELSRIPDLNPKATPAVCGGSAAEKLSKAVSPLEQNPARFYADFFENHHSVYTVKQQLSALLENEQAVVLPHMPKGDAFETDGMAVLSENSLQAIYPAKDVLLYNILNGECADLKIDTGNGVYRLESLSAPQIRIKTKDTPVVRITLHAEGEPLSGKQSILSNTDAAKKDITAFLKKDLVHFLSRAQKDGIDILNTASYAKKSFLTEKDFNAFVPKLKNAVFSVNISFKNTKIE